MPFVKGKSGNPGGRPKEANEVRELARQYGPEAILRLAFWMASDNAKASVSACNVLLDRGFGKPDQAIEHSGNVNIQVSPAERRRIEEERVIKLMNRLPQRELPHRAWHDA